MKCSRILFTALCLIISNVLFAQKIGFLLDDYISDRWFSDEKYFSEKVKELGGDVTVEVANADTTAQFTLAQKMLDAGVKVLVVVPTDSRKAGKIVDLAAQRHVPVIAYDRLILNEKLTAYVSFDNVKVGRLQAEYALKKMPTGKYILVNGPISDNNAVLFKQGQEEVLRPQIQNGKIKVVADLVMDDWGELGAMLKVGELIADKNNMPDAVIAANDALATGAITALPNSVYGKTVITGQDADLSAIRDIIAGKQTMTVYKPIKLLADKAAELAIQLARSQSPSGLTKLKSGNISVNAILLDAIAVDQSNYKETVVKDGHVKLSEIEKK